MKLSGPKYWYVAGELGEGAKAEDILRVMEAVGGVALKFALKKKKDHLDLIKKIWKMSEEQSKVHPEIAEVDWIDDAFYIEKTRFGLYKSIKKNGDGF